jgi:hypothetical protein
MYGIRSDTFRVNLAEAADNFDKMLCFVLIYM